MRDAALLLLRIVLGTVFVAHGWDKLVITGLTETTGQFSAWGVPQPKLSAWLVMAVELVGGALLAFIISMDDLVITYFIAGVDTQTLPVFIFGMLRRGIKPEVNAIAVMMLLFSFAVAALGIWLRTRQR